MVEWVLKSNGRLALGDDVFASKEAVEFMGVFDLRLGVKRLKDGQLSRVGRHHVD